MLILLLKDGNLRGLGTGASLCDGDRGVCPRRVAVLCKQRIMLTGTPLQNDLQELQNLLGFLLPDVFKDDAAAHLADVQVSPTAFGIYPCWLVACTLVFMLESAPSLPNFMLWHAYFP